MFKNKNLIDWKDLRTGLLMAAILGVLPAIYSLIKDTSIGEYYSICGKYLTIFLNYPLKVWWVLIGLVMLLAFAVYWYVKVFFRVSKHISENLAPQKHRLHFFNYRKDIFNGVQYRWSYDLLKNDKVDIVDLSTYCPKDNCKLLFGRCPICSTNYKDGIPEEVRILIWHKIDNDLYPK